eukprot:gene6568-9026_t
MHNSPSDDAQYDDLHNISVNTIYNKEDVGSVEHSELEGLKDGRKKSVTGGFFSAFNITNLTLMVVVIVGVLILIGVTSATFSKVIKINSTVKVVVTPLGLPDYADYTWDDVLTDTSGSTVRFWMWSGSSQINTWVDVWLAKQVADTYGITLVRVPLTSTADAVTQMKNEVVDKNFTTGKVDLVWINGENFYNAKSNGLLYGPFAAKIPSAENFDFESNQIKYDFGRTTNGYEVPYNEAQVVFIYNLDKFPDGPPQSMSDLVTWAKSNPGKFTYPNPSLDFTGSVLIRHFLYEFGPSGTSYKSMLGDFSSSVYNKRVPYAFQMLRTLNKYVYKINNQSYYPDNITASDTLFANEEIWLTLSYDPAHAGSLVSEGFWPNSTMSYVPTTGTISNTNFVAIGKYAKNKLAAIVVANFIASIGAQFNRRQPEQWGAIQCYDVYSDPLTKGGWQIAFDYLKTYKQTPSAASLRAGALPEMVAEYTTHMQSDWVTCVANYSNNANNNLCSV